MAQENSLNAEQIREKLRKKSCDVLVLDEHFPFEEILGAIERKRKKLEERGKYIFVLANREVLERHEDELRQAGILISGNWQTSEAYARALNNGIKNRGVYVPRRDYADVLTFIRAGKDEYSVVNQGRGNVDILPCDELNH